MKQTNPKTEKPTPGTEKPTPGTEKQTKVLCGVLWVLLCVAAYALGVAEIEWGLSRWYEFSMSAWGVTASNLRLAPWWIKAIAYGFGAFSAFLELAWVLLIGKILYARRKNEPFRPGRPPLLPGIWGFLAGAGLAAVCAALLLLADGVRMGRPLNMPAFSASTLPYALTLFFSAAAGEWFFRGLLYRGLGPNWLKTGLISMLFGLFFGMNGGFSAPLFLNLVLFSVLLCGVYDRTGSLWTCVGLRFGSLWLSQGLLGMGGAPGIYELYFTSRAWLSGGTGGPMAGLAMTLLLIACVGALHRKELRSVLHIHLR